MKESENFLRRRPRPVAVIFDWDETLAETRDLVVTSIQSTLDHYNLGIWDTVKKEKRDISKSLKENFVNFFGANAVNAYKFYLESPLINYWVRRPPGDQGGGGSVRGPGRAEITRARGRGACA